MPSSVQVNGSTIYKPGIRGRIDASALGGKSVSTGNVAVVGAFPGFPNDVPYTFSNPKALTAVDPTDLDLARIAKLAFSPASDDAVGGVNQLTIVNVQTCTQASFTFKDIAGADSLILKSRLYGQKGNRAYVKLLANTTDVKGLDVTIIRDGTTETYTDLKSGPVFEIIYDGGELTTTVFTANPTTWTWSWTKAMAALPGVIVGPATTQTSVYTPSAFLISGKLSVGLSSGAPAEGITVTVVGLDAAGAPQTGTKTFAEGISAAGYVQTAAVDSVWSSITSVTVSTTNAASTIVATLAGDAMVLTTADFATVGEMVSLINNSAAQGFKATARSAQISVIPAGQIDAQTSVDVKSPALATLRADLWAIVAALNKSALVTAERATAATLPTKHYNASPDTAEEIRLLGGTQSTVSVATDYAQALATIVQRNIQIVAVLDTTLAAATALKTHCANAAIEGYERNGYYGAPTDTSLATLLSTYTSAINSRHIAVCAQEIQVESLTGALEWLSPAFQAVQLMGMQGGTPVATPLTNKKPNVYDVRSNWTEGVDDNEVIQKGICAYTVDDETGIKVLRSVTSYLTDDNPFYSEVSANESGNTSVRRVRAAMNAKIGSSGTTVSAAALTGPFIAELKKQVKDGVIKAYRNPVVTDGGDSFSFDYDFAAVEPFNFGNVVAHVYRTA